VLLSFVDRSLVARRPGEQVVSPALVVRLLDARVIQDGTPVLVDERTIRPVEPWCSWFRHLAYQDKAAKAMREYAYIVLWFALS